MSKPCMVLLTFYLRFTSLANCIDKPEICLDGECGSADLDDEQALLQLNQGVSLASRKAGPAHTDSQAVHLLSKSGLNVKKYQHRSQRDTEKLPQATFTEGFDCTPFDDTEFDKPVLNWPWQERICKARDSDGQPNGDLLLWQGCVVQQNLTQGAIWYFQKGKNELEAAYCFTEHCWNEEFDLESTTVEDEERYCDKRFDGQWRNEKVGVGGYGDSAGPGTGLWECAHSNYHCDWAYCKFGYCNNPDYEYLRFLR